MPMARTFLFIITFFVFLYSYAAGVYVRNNGHYSEFVLSGMADSIVSVSEGESRLMIELVTPLSVAAADNLNDPFFRAVSIDGRMLSITFYPDTDYTMSKKDGDIHVTAARKKTTDGIQLGYGIEKPLIKGTSKILENKNAEEILGMIDEKIAADEYGEALTLTENFLNTDVDGYYRQEGLFRLGMIYFDLGEFSDDNYIFASKIFDDFIKEYPDSFRRKDALIKSAESKEMAMLYNEAIFAYDNVIKSLRNRELQKMAYKRIAEIYAKMGQYDKAIEAHQDVIRNFKETYTEQNAKIGMLHAKKKDFDLAYRSFLTVWENQNELGNVGAEELYTMGNVFSEKGRNDDARIVYEKVYSIYPANDLADMAMFRSAVMFEKMGSGQAADARLDICRQVYKDQEGGLRCSIMYARRHVDEKTPEDWEKFLEPALTSEDLNMRSEAELVMIRAYFGRDQYEKADERVTQFIRRNFTSEYLPEVYKIRQRIILTQAKEAYRKSDYPYAKALVEDMLKNFPETEYKREALEILQDIRFGDIKDMFQEGRYKETVDELQKYLLENNDLINPDKWMDMLQEAKYAYAKQLYDQNELTGAAVAAAEYTSSFPKGTYLKEAKQILVNSLSKTMDDYYQSKEFLKIISLYDQNAETIQNDGDREFRDKLRSYTAFALYKMGVKDNAVKLLEDVESKDNPYYLMTAIMLGQITDQVDPNVFTEGMMDYLVQELEQDKPDYMVEMLRNYSKDKVYAAKQIYSISKGVFDDLKREKILFDLYNRLDKDETARFEGFDEVFMDAGISYYKRNNFENAVSALEKFKLHHMPRDEKRAEGLYYLGKSYMKMDKSEEAVNAFMELLESVPDSVYASAARSELEEMKWRKNLRK